MNSLNCGTLLPTYRDLLKRFGPGVMTRVAVVYVVGGVVEAYDLCIKVVRRSANRIVCKLVDVYAFEDAPLPSCDVSGALLHIIPRRGFPAQVLMQKTA